jgi:hypothetical protein
MAIEPVPQVLAVEKRDSQFPRTAEVSEDSPLFWVENKDRFLRQQLIRDIERVTGRRLCVFFCNPYLSSNLEQHDVGRLFEILNTDDCSPFDLLLETTGGETDATEAIVSMLRSVQSDMRVIVPSQAKSNGTVICLAAKEILMGATSQLGPIEPYVLRIPASVLELPAYERISLLHHELGKHAKKQTIKIAKDLLRSGMMKSRDEQEIEAAVMALSTRDEFPSHGSVIDAREAIRLGLNIEQLPVNSHLWRMCWLLYSMYSFDCNLRGIAKIFEGRKFSKIIVEDANGDTEEEQND